MTGLEAKKLREKLNLTQEELGLRVGKTKRTIITWEQSEKISASAEQLLISIFKEESLFSQEIKSVEEILSNLESIKGKITEDQLKELRKLVLIYWKEIFSDGETKTTLDKIKAEYFRQRITSIIQETS